MLKGTEKLEAALRHWEDYFMLVHADALMHGNDHGKMVRKWGAKCPQLCYGSLRQYMLDYKEGPFDHESYSTGLKEGGVPVGGTMDFVPYGLTMWVQQSRRVYHLSSDLQALLMNTAVADLSIADISWPFRSFVVTMETPVIDGSGKNADCILVAPFERLERPGVLMMGEGDQQLQIQLIFNDVIAQGVFSRQERKRLKKAIQSGHVVHETQLIKQTWTKISRMREIPPPVSSVLLNLSHAGGLKMKDVMEKWGDNRANPVQLVIGLCMYLRSLPTGSRHVVRRAPTPQRKGLSDCTAITDGANVCTVTSVYKLSDMERAIVSSHTGHSGIELRAHWREGHWRRPPGKGSDPNYPKTVWVRPALVRRDRLPTGAVPEGITKVM